MNKPTHSLTPHLVVFVWGCWVLWQQSVQVLGDLVQHALHRPLVAVPLQMTQELAFAQRALPVASWTGRMWGWTKSVGAHSTAVHQQNRSAISCCCHFPGDPGTGVRPTCSACGIMNRSHVRVNQVSGCSLYCCTPTEQVSNLLLLSLSRWPRNWRSPNVLCLWHHEQVACEGEPSQWVLTLLLYTNRTGQQSLAAVTFQVTQELVTVRCALSVTSWAVQC